MTTTRHALDTSFAAPNVSEDTPVEFTLEVSDGTDTVTDKVTVTITDSANTAPTVDAGGDQTVTEGSTVNLDGTATDPDSEDTLTYSWSHNSTALTPSPLPTTARRSTPPLPRPTSPRTPR